MTRTARGSEPPSDRGSARGAAGARPDLRRVCAPPPRDGYAPRDGWPYTSTRCRTASRSTRCCAACSDAGEARGEILGSPFAPRVREAFLRVAAARRPDAPPGVNRLLAHLYGTRDRSADAFPDLAGAHGRADEWTRDRARQRCRRSPTCRCRGRPSGPGPTPPAAESATRPPIGVALGCQRRRLFPLRARGRGGGPAGGQRARRARRAGARRSTARTIPLSRQGHAFTHSRYADARYPVNLICMNADMLPDFAAQAGRRSSTAATRSGCGSGRSPRSRRLDAAVRPARRGLGADRARRPTRCRRSRRSPS